MMSSSDGVLRSLLEQRAEGRAWLDHLESKDLDGVELALPGPDEIVDELLYLALPHEDIGPLIRHMPTEAQYPDTWRLLQSAARSVVSVMGSFDNPPRMPELGSDDPMLRYFYIYVFLALKPLVESWHREHGIPADISRSTLADLGRNMAVHRKRHGTSGFGFQNWLQYHFHGAIYQLGRLQFQRAILGESAGNAIRAAGHPYGPGDPTLSVHIPDFYGPFRPDLCDASIVRAKKFFAEHFPEETYRVAVCHSWLLDPQLASYLSETSNVIQFQRRFTIVGGNQEATDDVPFEFVFGRKAAEIDSLPRDTGMQRALIDHVRSGGHWRVASGWLLL